MELLERFEASHPRDRPHYYLSLLGTHPDRRGAGLGMGLLAENLERIDEQGMPAFLESSNPVNDSRYERLGFQRIGEFSTPDGSNLVATMWREPRSGTLDLVRLARQGYEAMSRGDFDGVMSLFAADAVYDGAAAGIGSFEGAEAIRGFVEDWRRSWENYRYEEEELLDLGHGIVLSVVRETGRLVGGEGHVEQRAAHVITWTNGKILRFKHYPDPDEARVAAERLARERATASD
jgi:ketosteroid isomerase-like protein